MRSVTRQNAPCLTFDLALIHFQISLECREDGVAVAYIARKSFDLKPCEIEADAALRDFYVPTAAENIHSSRMSHMGQTRTSRHVRARSGQPPLADIR